ncbi:MAG: tetratricopeptide repeat protein [Bacteroidota bacterium]
MRAHKIHYFFMLVFCSMLCLDGLAQGAGKGAYIQAENLRKSKRYQEAIAKYDEAINLEPNNYRYFFSRGKCYYAMKDFDQALVSFEESVEYNKENVFAYTLIAKIYRRKEDLPNAVYYYDLAFKNEKDPKRKVGYKMEAVKLLLSQGKTEEAQSHLAEVKRVVPDNLNILYFDAKISNQNGDYANAKSNMEVATAKLEGQPAANAAKYWYEYGYALNKLDDYQGAQKAWEKAYFGRYKRLIDRERSKNSPAYFYRMAVSYYLVGAYNQSKEQIDKALELQSNFSAAYLLMGKMAKKQGDFTSAIDHYTSAANFENDPAKKTKLQTMLASLQLDAGDYQGALNTSNNVLSAQPGNPRVLYTKALSQFQLGMYDSSISTLESLLSASSDNRNKAKYQFIIGLAAKNTDIEKAKNAFRAAMYGPYKPAAKNELDKLMGKEG